MEKQVSSRTPPQCLRLLPEIDPPRISGWQKAPEDSHFVQFYNTDDYLIECLAGFVSDGLWKGERTLVIATPEHRLALETRLRLKSIDVAASMLSGQYITLDAKEMLSQFMRAGSPEPTAFEGTVGHLIEKAVSGNQRLRAFGEMVALLWVEGHREAAIELELLWNDLGSRHAFTLFCAYPANAVEVNSDGISLAHICRAHSKVVQLTA
jgi:hypothetical protein